MEEKEIDQYQYIFNRTPMAMDQKKKKKVIKELASTLIHHS